MNASGRARPSFVKIPGAMVWIAVCIGLVLLLFLPAGARAHEFWLTPSVYRASAGDTVGIGAFVGTGFRGEARPYAPTHTLEFTLRGPRTIDLSPAGMNGDLVFARFVVADGGGALVSYHSSFTPIELEATAFDRYLALEGLDAPLRARGALGGREPPGRERYARCAKTWIDGTDLKRAITPVGFPLEIVPLSDPASGAALAVRVLAEGIPLEGILVRAWRSPLGAELVPRDAAARDSSGSVSEARTGRDGVAVLRVAEAGEWLLSAVHMTPSRDREAADWESNWASFTFAKGPGTAAGKEGRTK